MLIGGAVYTAFLLGGGSTVLALFAVALAGTGLLTTVGVIVAMEPSVRSPTTPRASPRCRATSTARAPWC